MYAAPFSAVRTARRRRDSGSWAPTMALRSSNTMSTWWTQWCAAMPLVLPSPLKGGRVIASVIAIACASARARAAGAGKELALDGEKGPAAPAWAGT